MISLSSAATDTFIAWILLAIILAFAASGAGTLGKLTPLWTFLIAVSHMIFLWFVVRKALIKMGDEVKRKVRNCNYSTNLMKKELIPVKTEPS